MAALRGLDGTVAESTPEPADRERVAASLDRGLRCGKFGEADRDQALARQSFTDDLGVLADRQIVIEAVAENMRSEPMPGIPGASPAAEQPVDRSRRIR